MRGTLLWMSVEVVIGVRIVQCHAIIDVVIDVRVMQCHAIIDVVIGVRVMLCHQAIDNSGFSTFLNFPLRVQILILLSSCINSSSLFPVAILCTLLHRENTSFEVWYLHFQSLPKTDPQVLERTDYARVESHQAMDLCFPEYLCDVCVFFENCTV